MCGLTNHSIQRDSCLSLRYYSSLILGLQKRIHTVVINNKTLIILWWGCVKDKIEYIMSACNKVIDIVFHNNDDFDIACHFYE